MLRTNGQAVKTARRGAYGLAVDSDIDAEMLVCAPASWPQWKLRVRRDTELPSEFDPADADLMVLAVQPRGASVSSRSQHTTTIVVPTHSPHALAHPYLASAALAVSPWFGRTSFHGGGFLLDGHVWGVLADREGGKTSTMAWLALHGYPVFSDDVMVVDHHRAFAGPRILDLRRSAAEFYGAGEPIGLVGARERWRMKVDEVPSEAPLGGWVSLTWSEIPFCEWVPTESRASVLRAHKGLHTSELDHFLWLDLLAKPMLRFGRPKEWSEIDSNMEGLIDRLSLASREGRLNAPDA